MFGAEKQLQRVRAHEGDVRKWKASEQLTLAKIRDHIESTTLTWPSAIPLLRWVWLRPCLTSLFFIGYVVCSLLATYPSPLLWADASATITEFNHVQGLGDILIITFLILSSAGWICLYIRRNTAHVVMVTFRQSPCWYYPRPDAAVSTSTDTQHLGHNDIPVITPIISMYLSTTSVVFTPAGHVNVLQLARE